MNYKHNTEIVPQIQLKHENDSLPWSVGKLYKTNCIESIPAGCYFPKKLYYNEFIWSVSWFKFFYNLSHEEAVKIMAKLPENYLKHNDIFLLVGTCYEEQIFVILHGQQKKYVSRTLLNTFGKVEEIG